MTSYKILISLAEVFAAILLLYFVKFRTIAINSKTKKKNIVVLAVISTTVIFEFCPNILDILFFNITEQFSENVVGPYRTTLSSFNILTSAVLYSYVLKPKTSV
uniref:Uncharacterized protein n=1 Tax=Panagrolaimus sp. PS1159 TaxID=55785 RepID=A0AC35FGL0_9BILA